MKIYFIVIILIFTFAGWFFISDNTFGKKNEAERYEVVSKSSRRSLVRNSKISQESEIFQESKPSDFNSFKQILEKIASEKDGLKRRSQILELARIWVQSDIEACLAWAETLPQSDYSSALVPIVTFLLSDEGGQVGKALDILSDLERGEARDDVIMMNFPALMLLDPLMALEEIEKFSNSYAIKGSAQSLITRDPDYRDKVDFFLENLPNGEFREEYILSFVEKTAASNPAEAGFWLENNNVFDNRNKAYSLLGKAFAEDDPLAGLSFADSVADSSSKRKFLQALVSRWSSENIEDASEWMFSEIQNGKFSEIESLSGPILGSLVRSSPEDVFQSLDDISNTDDRSRLAIELVKHAAGIDPKFAAKMIYQNGVKKIEGSGIHIGDVVSNWLRRDSFAAAEWVLSIPASNEKDQAVSLVIEDVLEKDGDHNMAVKWLGQIDNPQIRREMNQKIVDFGE